MPFLEDYTLLDELGRGGFATVYKVRHNKLGYIRAVRVLNNLITKGVDDDIYKKFEKECKVLLKLGNGCHPNIVRIYQPYLKDMKALVEMDYVDGMDIVHFLKQKDNFLEVDEVMNLLSQISSALAYCHEDIYKFCMNKDEDDLKDDPNDGSKVLMDEPTRRRLIEKYRVVHNDIHHGNIMRRENGTYVLLDFGLAIEGDEVVRSSRFQNGVPEFMAPEKWDSDSITTQSDIYSFGILLYECLAGRVPFVYDTTVSKKSAMTHMWEDHEKSKPEPILPLRRAAFEKSHKGQSYTKDYPDWLEQLIMKCLAKKPSDRFANGKELYDFVVKQLGNESNDDKLRDANEQIARLEQQVASLKNEINNIKAPANQKDVDKLVIDLQVRLKELESAKSSLENKIKTYQTENDALRLLTKGHEGDADTINKLRGEKATLDNEKKDLNARVQKLSTKLSSAANEIKKLQQEVKDLKNKKGISKPVFYSVLGALLVLCAVGFTLYFSKCVASIKQGISIGVKGQAIEMVWVEGGTFQMGGNDGDSDEKPVHSVTLDGYYIGKYEVTQALWQAVMGGNPSYFKGKNRPVESVSWEDCQQFVSKLNQLTGLRFSLPTEAQWEYAARGGSKSRGYTYSGGDMIEYVAWYGDNCGGKTHPVGLLQPNELGIYDMTGNVLEWCSDWYDSGYYSKSPSRNPVNTTATSYRVARGGGWSAIAEINRVANRYGGDPTIWGDDAGMRLVLLP